MQSKGTKSDLETVFSSLPHETQVTIFAFKISFQLV